MGRKGYTEEFKRKVLTESCKRKKVAEVAREYGVDQSTVHRWEQEKKGDKKVKYTKEYMKMVVKTKFLKNYTAKECAKLFKLPEYLVTFWTDEVKDEVLEEIRLQKLVKRKRVFVHATSHSGYYK